MRGIANITGGFGEIDFFDNLGFLWVLEHDNITGGIAKLDFSDNIVYM
jgi:hypothetical protein